jgi:hypothetical protein
MGEGNFSPFGGPYCLNLSGLQAEIMVMTFAVFMGEILSGAL